MIAALALAAAIAVPSRPASYATDTAGALRTSTVQSLNAELQSYYSATGNTVFVWVGQSTGDTPLEDWTMAAASKWKVGHAHKDDGAILFVFMQDHKARIEVGYGLEGSLTDAASSRIIRNTIVPRMRAGDADGAIQNGVDAMLVAITPSYAQKLGRPVQSDAQTASAADTTLSRSDIAAMIFILVIIVVVILRIARAARKGGGHWISTGPFVGGFLGGSGGGGFGGGGGGFSGGFGGGFGGGGASGGW